MTITIGHGQVQAAARADGRGTLRRIADLQTVIEHQEAARNVLSARGLATGDLDRVIDILVCSLQLLRGYHAAMEDERVEREALVLASAVPKESVALAPRYESAGRRGQGSAVAG